MSLEEYRLKLSGYDQVLGISSSSRWIIGLTSVAVLAFWGWLFYRFVLYLE